MLTWFIFLAFFPFLWQYPYFIGTPLDCWRVTINNFNTYDINMFSYSHKSTALKILKLLIFILRYDQHFITKNFLWASTVTHSITGRWEGSAHYYSPLDSTWPFSRSTRLCFKNMRDIEGGLGFKLKTLHVNATMPPGPAAECKAMCGGGWRQHLQRETLDGHRHWPLEMFQTCPSIADTTRASLSWRSSQAYTSCHVVVGRGVEYLEDQYMRNRF